MKRKIVGFHKDENSDWVAELNCGHNQHTRHKPPFEIREWVTSELGRQSRLGSELNCVLCDEAEIVDKDHTFSEDTEV